jgi:branched-chain amino acid transport system substrate-binding protein
VSGTATPADFATFWTQSKQQGFNPKLVTVAKAVSNSSAMDSLGPIGDGLATDLSWSPEHPFSSSLTGQPSRQLSDEYEASTGKQWTQFMGFVHALFEVCFDVVARAGSTDKQAIADAAASTNLATIVGPVAYGTNGLPRNVSRTSLVGGQWQKRTGAAFPFELLVVENNQSPGIPTNGQLKPLI